MVAEPTTPEGHFDRGIEMLGRDMTSVAETHFLTANRLRPESRNAALLGYCRCKLGDEPTAALWFKQAIELDRQPAWVYNNLAYSLIQSGMVSRNLLKEADEAASKAIGLDGSMTAAFHNRAWAQYFFNLDRKKRCLTDANCLPRLEADISKAMTDRTNPDLFLLAALVNAASPVSNPKRLDAAMSMLQEAIRCGLAPNRIKSDPILRAHLGQRADFLALPSTTRTFQNNSGHNSRLINPLKQ